MGSSLPDTIVQLSFPAAVQIVTLFIPALYLVVRRNAALERDLLRDPERITALVAALLLCDALYIASAVLLLVRGDALAVLGPGGIAHLDGSGALTLIILAILLVFACLPLALCIDAVLRYRNHLGGLPVEATEDDLLQKVHAAMTSATPRASLLEWQRLRRRLVDLSGAPATPQSTHAQEIVAAYCTQMEPRLLVLGLTSLCERQANAPPLDALTGVLQSSDRYKSVRGTLLRRGVSRHLLQKSLGVVAAVAISLAYERIEAQMSVSVPAAPLHTV